MRTIIFLLSTLFFLSIIFLPAGKTYNFEDYRDTIIIENPHKLVTYDFGNKYLMAMSDSKLNINKYWVANIAPSIIVEDSWKTKILINNEQLLKPNQTLARSNILLNTYKLENIETEVSTFVDNSTNAIFQKYNFYSLNNNENTVEITFTFSFDLGVNERDLIIEYINKGDNYYFIAYNDNQNIAAIFSSNFLPYDYEINGRDLKILFNFKTDELKDFYTFISGGFTKEKEEHIANRVFKNWGKHYKNAIDRANWIDNLFYSEDKLLDQMFSVCIDCALSNYKVDENVNFNAFYAGVRYKEPARTYYRDSYWTIQSILPFKPELVRQQIIALAKGIHDDGACGSGVKFDGSDWWSNHYDSSSFFVMMIYDYIIWTGDISILDETTKGKIRDNGEGIIEFSEEKSVWVKAKKTMEWLQKTDRNKNNLIQKPKNVFGDWADEVARINEVTYVNALYYKALKSMNYLSELTGEYKLSKSYAEQSIKLKNAINQYLWDKDKGYYVDFITTNNKGKIIYKEDHFMEDTFTALLFGIADPDQISSSFEYAHKWLESRNNFVQPYGDWGTLCTWPLYKKTTYRRPRESDDPYRYHNGADWPYLDGINALTRLLFNDSHWEYPIKRWWEKSLENYWLTPVEYYQPEYPEGGFKQAWSSMPAAALIMGGFGFAPHLINNNKLKIPSFGNAEVKGLKYRGYTFDIIYKDGSLSVYRNNKKLENNNIF